MRRDAGDRIPSQPLTTTEVVPFEHTMALLQAAAGSRKLANHTDPRTQGGDKAEAYRFDPAADPRFVAAMNKVHHHTEA